MYHYLTGYTSKVAGTERGITEPQATFSTAFGAPFLPLPPLTYAKLLGERIAKHETNVYLVNTGWPLRGWQPDETGLHPGHDPRSPGR